MVLLHQAHPTHLTKVYLVHFHHPMRMDYDSTLFIDLETSLVWFHNFHKRAIRPSNSINFNIFSKYCLIFQNIYLCKFVKISNPIYVNAVWMFYYNLQYSNGTIFSSVCQIQMEFDDDDLSKWLMIPNTGDALVDITKV